MRSQLKFSTLGSIAAVSILLAACSSPSVKVAETPAQAKPDMSKPKPDDSRKIESVSTVVDPLDDPKGVLAKRSVYFDFDQYVVKSEYSPVVEAHSRYLGANKGRKILIQGNTDERGGSEYNLALGQKRAEAVRKAMALSGTPDAQMEAVSLGKEKPKASGSNEAAWAENRRADIVYSAK
ncbi:peptidoglycan-associated lipoprotein Pal [Undibacterium sp. TJN19]|uniref:peptidoglycan-associated lipoprotein Pal n=1 Tax=Undibacterium sp. TJN19 TaxID=3413055 RepID=UPI003BF26680